jgi:hypothetical protein
MIEQPPSLTGLAIILQLAAPIILKYEQVESSSVLRSIPYFA